MAFCRNCGQQMNDGAEFCPNCGTPVKTAAAPDNGATNAAPNYGASNNGAPYDQAAQQAAQQTTQQPIQPQVVMAGDADVQANKSIAWLSYLGLLLLIPMLAKKESEYCRYHVKQGATLFAVEIVYSIVTEIIKAISRAVFPGELKYNLFTGYYYAPSAITTIFTILFGLGSIFLLVLAIIGIVNSASGKTKELPLIGKIPFIADLLDKLYYKR